MKIGFDGKRAIRNFTGLGNYSRYVLNILSRFFPENEYEVFAAKAIDNDRMSALLEKNTCLKMQYATGMGAHFPALWRSWGIGNRLKTSGIQLYHGLSNELPFNIRKSGVKSIVTIHDLIFLRQPDCYSPIDRMIYNIKFRKACEDADQIVAVSECTKRDIIALYHIPEEKILTVYQNCDPVFSVSVAEEKKNRIRETYRLPEQYILNVGSVEKRKNALSIVKSLLRLPNDIHLVIVGRRTKYAELIDRFVAEHQLEKRVHLLDKVSFDDLPAIYQQASLFVYPSVYEGFGIPVLEALHSKVPVISTRLSSMEEAGGASSIYVAPYAVDELAQAELSVLTDERLRQQMIDDGLKHAVSFSDELQAKKLIELYQRLIG